MPAKTRKNKTLLTKYTRERHVHAFEQTIFPLPLQMGYCDARIEISNNSFRWI